MIEKELHDEIRKVATSHAILESHDNDVPPILDSIMDAFIDPLAGQWWWQNINGESVTIEYGEHDGLSVIQDLITNSEPVYFIPTDDECPPWPIFLGNRDKIVELVRELRYFEFILTDKNITWAVFDTHHNSIVVVGDLMNRAREIQVPIG